MLCEVLNMNDSVKEYAKRTAKPIKIKNKDVGSSGSNQDNFLYYEVRFWHFILFFLRFN